jgi:hypothetical protein
MTITSFLVINSKHRNADSRSVSDFTFSVGQSLEVTAVAVKSISIPNVQYNINVVNNKLRIYTDDVGTFVSLTLPVGQYDITTFMADLQALLRTAVGDATLVITRSTLTDMLTVTTTTQDIKFSIDPVVSPLGKVFGMGDGAGETYPLLVSSSITSQFLHNLSGLQNYYLSSRALSQGYNGIFKEGDQIPLVMAIPIDVEHGFTEHYEPTDLLLNIKKYGRPQNIQWIDIKIYDKDLNIVDLLGQDIEIVLKIYTQDNPAQETESA